MSHNELEHLKIFIQQIESCYRKADAAISAFVLTFVLADSICSLYLGKDGKRANFEHFLTLFEETKRYSQANLYKLVRCPLLHNFSVSGFLFTHGRPSIHMNREPNSNQLILNFEDFFGDIRTVTEKIIEQVENPKNEADQEIKNTVANRIKKRGVIHKMEVHSPAEFDQKNFSQPHFKTHPEVFSASGTSIL